MGGVDTPVGRVSAPKHWAKLSKYIKEGGGQYLSFYHGPHIETFLNDLGGVDTPIGRVLVPTNVAKLSKCMRECGVNVSASTRTPCTKFVWRFLRHMLR